LSPFLIVLICILAVVLIGLVVLTIVGKKLQGKQDSQRKQIDAAAQTLSILVIDKKMMKLKDAGLPAIVMEQTPKYLRRVKMPVVKAKVGPRVLTLIADKAVFDTIPVKTSVKATISGIYITAVRAERGALLQPAKKKGLRAKLMAKANSLQQETKNSKKK